MTSYSKDFIIADLDEMEKFLYEIRGSKDQLNQQMHSIMRKYHGIINWDDNVVERTGEILEKIRTQIDRLTEVIDYANKQFGKIIDGLREYNDVNGGSFGRL